MNLNSNSEKDHLNEFAQVEEWQSLHEAKESGARIKSRITVWQAYEGIVGSTVARYDTTSSGCDVEWFRGRFILLLATAVLKSIVLVLPPPKAGSIR